MGKKTDDISGMEFGRLTALDKLGEDKNGYILWNCSCSCGGSKVVRSKHLFSGHTQSCGCITRESNRERNETHGRTGTPAYNSWAAMRSRCCIPNSKSYYNYGGRGIKICDRWLDSFETFLEDMGERPEGLTLDRIDSNGDYTPENCRWATRTTQMRNRRNTFKITFEGILAPATAVAEHFGVSPSSFRKWARANGEYRASSYLEERCSDFSDKLASWKGLTN